MKKLLLILTGLIIILASCKKKMYPEDDVKSKDSPSARLIANDWLIESFTINGIDSTCGCVFKFTPPTNGTTDFNFKYVNPNDTCGCIAGHWHFYDTKKNNIVISPFSNGPPTTTNYHPFVCTCTNIWEIRKLSEGMLWLKKDCCGDILELKCIAYQI